MRGAAIALLLTSASLGAAQTGSASAKSMVLEAGAANCPIAIEAHPQSRGAYLLVGSAPAVHPAFEVTFRSRDDRAIQQVVLALSGPSGAGLRQAMSAPAAKNNVETFTLTSAGGTVKTSKLTGVQWLSLVSVSYADGTGWQRTEANRCIVAPNGFVPVQ